MTFQLKHGTGENFVGPCDLIFSRLLGQLSPRLKGVPMIVTGRFGFSKAYALWTFCQELELIGVWGNGKKQAVWVANMSREALVALRAVDISDLVEEEIVPGFSWLPAELPRRLLAVYPDKKDVVADPFMERGTVGKAVLEYGGDFIGMDRSKERVHFAHEFLGCQSI